MVNHETLKLATRFVTGYGIADCPLERCCQRLQTFRIGPDARFCLLETTLDPARALDYLALLAFPDTRHVIFPAGEGCTGFINNSRNGSDYADHTVWLARHLQSRFARVVCAPGRVWSDGSQRVVMQYAARILDLRDECGEIIRSVHCMNDGGRWRFSECGARHAVESTFPYDARRKSDRFTEQHLEQLMRAFGLPRVSSESFLAAGRYCVFDTPGHPAQTCTIAEADDPAYGYYLRGLCWVPHMATHASSVVADFERCLRINPVYEPKVRPALDEAYRVLREQG